MSETEIVWPDATDLLRDDEAFGPVVREVGSVRMPLREGSPFASLLRAIVYQQLAGAAASTIHGRVLEALGGDVSPAAVLETPEAELRNAGLSASKLRAVRDLSEKTRAGDLPLRDLDGRSDQEVLDGLTSVWGVGAWTARMFLLGHLRRPDVWPVGDLGVRKGWARIHGLEAPPSAGDLEPMGDPYRPWRSAVAWYCWRATEIEPPT